MDNVITINQDDIKEVWETGSLPLPNTHVAKNKQNVYTVSNHKPILFSVPGWQEWEVTSIW